MQLGSVDRRFKIPESFEEIEYNCENTEKSKLYTVEITNHLYKLLIAEYSFNVNHSMGYELFPGSFPKPLMGIILDLDRLQFPFMRITDNNSVKQDIDY